MLTSHHTEPVPDESDSSRNHEAIAELAYRYYEERGRADGHHEEDWHLAEQELREMNEERSAVTGHAA